MAKSVTEEDEASFTIEEVKSILGIFTPTAMKAAYKKLTGYAFTTENKEQMIESILANLHATKQRKQLGVDWIFFGVGHVRFSSDDTPKPFPAVLKLAQKKLSLLGDDIEEFFFGMTCGTSTIQSLLSNRFSERYGPERYNMFFVLYVDKTTANGSRDVGRAIEQRTHDTVEDPLIKFFQDNKTPKLGRWGSVKGGARLYYEEIKLAIVYLAVRVKAVQAAAVFKQWNDLRKNAHLCGMDIDFA